MRKIFLITFLFFVSGAAFANPIISGISTNEINIDTKFQGAKILLFGAKGDAGNVVVAVRGPKKNFVVTKKQKPRRQSRRGFCLFYCLTTGGFGYEAGISRVLEVVLGAVLLFKESTAILFKISNLCCSVRVFGFSLLSWSNKTIFS